MLRSLSQRKRRMYYESHLGTTQKVLFEQEKDSYWTGLTDNYIRVQTKSKQNLTNKIFNVKLQKIHDSGILGKIRDK